MPVVHARRQVRKILTADGPSVVVALSKRTTRPRGRRAGVKFRSYPMHRCMLMWAEICFRGARRTTEVMDSGEIAQVEPALILDR